MTRVYLIHSETGSRIRHSKFKKANRGRHSRASGADPSNIYWIFDGSRLIRLVFSLQKVISRLQRGHDKRRNRSAALPLKVLFQRPRDIEKKNFWFIVFIFDSTSQQKMSVEKHLNRASRQRRFLQFPVEELRQRNLRAATEALCPSCITRKTIIFLFENQLWSWET